MRIFISYRREDSEGYAGRLYDRLSQRFGQDSLFMDVDTLRPGQDFVLAIENAMDASDVLVALIGKRWLTITDDEGNRRLDNPHDFVRLEIASALSRDMLVVPVLVQGALMPHADELPENLKSLTRRHALEISSARFHDDVDRLVNTIEDVLAREEARREGTVHAIAPAPELPVDQPETRPSKNRWLWIGAAGAGVVVLAVALGGLPGKEEPIPEVTLTSAPADDPTEIVATPTEDPIALAKTGVTSNTDWTPVIETFGGVDMALVPAGCFMMGSEDGNADEGPVHEQCFEQPFWIDVHEVTNGQFGSDGYFSGADRPHESVNWFDATAHCESREARLPTEAEWEYAARGPDGLVFPWANEFDGSLANFCDTRCTYDWSDDSSDDGYGDEPAPLDSYPDGVSWVGAQNMSGNLWEWVSTLYVDYRYDANDGREVDGATNSQASRVMRGGSWVDGAAFLRNANRGRNNPYYTAISLGFRCARS